MDILNAFTLAGVAVFAASGALAAARRSLDPVGVLVLATVTAVGGGTLRDVLMNRHPIFWISTPSVLAASTVAAAVTWFWVKRFPPPDRALSYADAIGLAFFSIAGAQTAQGAGLSPLIATIMGTITGCAGGLIRDVLVAEIPLIFRQSELYVSACVLGIVIYFGLIAIAVPVGWASLAGMAVIAVTRVASIYWSIVLPVLDIPNKN